MNHFPSIKTLRSLRHKKYRQAHGLYLIEGTRLVNEAVRSPRSGAEQVLTTPDFLASRHWSPLERQITARGVPVVEITATQAEQLSDTRTPQGIFAVVRLPQEVPDMSVLTPPLLILDDISDPGNVGTLLRTADWFGLSTVLASAYSADLYGPKVVRGAMGAHFHLNYLWQGDVMSWADSLRSAGTRVFGAHMQGSPLADLKVADDRWALVVGSEAHGLSDTWRERLDEAVTIAGSGEAESLNVAVAAGIILHHLISNR